MISPVGSTTSSPMTKVAGDAVLDAARPAGIFGHIAAKGGELERCRVRRIEEPQFFHLQLELLGHDTRLHFGNQVLGIDPQDPVQAG